MKLNIGCGKDIRRGAENWINVDYIALPGVDIVHNISKPLPFKDNEFEYILASHIVEHVAFEEKMPLIMELWRVTAPGGKIEIFCPNWNHRNTFMDPTHLSAWQINTFDYFVPGHWANYYGVARFKVLVKEERGDEKEELHWLLEVIK